MSVLRVGVSLLSGRCLLDQTHRPLITSPPDSSSRDCLSHQPEPSAAITWCTRPMAGQDTRQTERCGRDSAVVCQPSKCKQPQTLFAETYGFMICGMNLTQTMQPLNTSTYLQPSEVRISMAIQQAISRLPIDIYTYTK